MSPRPFAPLGALLLALCGCAEPTALDLTLVADPNVNSEAALLARLNQIKLTMDAPAGLYDSTATCQEPRDGELLVCDVDGDQQGELVTRIDLDGADHLPLIRVERGGLDDPLLELRIDGVGPDPDQALTPVAAGGVQGISFVGGEVVPVQVPFNLLAKYRPPRVTQVYPESGAQLDPAVLGSVVLIFSKQMDRASLTRPQVIQLLRVEGSQETPVQPAAIVPGEVYAGGPTKVDLQLSAVLDSASYRVRVSQGALDSSGRALDQVPMQPGNQPFTSGFTLLPLMATPTTCPQSGCETLWCTKGGTTCAKGLKCVAGACLPDGCPASCDALTVCDPSLGLCVEDCRLHGTYCGDGKLCDAKTGLCS